MCSAIYPTFSVPSRVLRLPPQRVQYGELAAVGAVQEVAGLELASSSSPSSPGVAVVAIRAVGHPGGAAAAPRVLFSRKKHKKFSGGNLGKFVSRSRKVSSRKRSLAFFFLTWQKYFLKRKATRVRHMATQKIRGPWSTSRSIVNSRLILKTTIFPPR